MGREVLEVGESDAEGRKTQEKERAKKHGTPRKSNRRLQTKQTMARTEERGAFSSNHRQAGFSTGAFPSVTRSLDEEAASLTSHGRASGRVRRHNRHLVPGCKIRHDPLANNAHTGPTTQSTVCRQPASRGSGDHRMNDRHWKCLEKRRSNEHGAQGKQAH